MSTGGDDHLIGLDSRAWGRVEEAVRRLREALRRGERPDLAEGLPAEGPERRACLVELVHEELEFRRKAAEPATAEEYLARFPELAAEGVARSLRAAEARSGPPASLGGPPGRLGRYRLREEVGRGAFGIVYRAEDPELGRSVAIKIAHPGRSTTDEAADRFVREARAAAALRHPNLVTIFEVGREAGRPYLVGEFIEGGDLARRLAAGRPTPRQAAAWAAALADGLAAAHAAGIVHRDVKPANVLIDAEERPHLADFGLARWADADVDLTRSGQALGTPAYMAPEQARGDARSADPRSDVYSLGVVLYEMLTGERPFRGAGRLLLAQVLKEDPRPPRRLVEAIPRDLETICLKAMAKEPAHRYAAADLAADLRRFLDGRPVVARPVGWMTAHLRRARRRPVLAGTLATLAAVAVLGFAGITWQSRRAERYRRVAEARLAEVEATRRDVVRALARSHEAIHDLNSILLDAVVERPGEAPAQRDLVARALERHRQFGETLRSQPALLPELVRARLLIARAATRVGSPDEALRDWREAVALAEALHRSAVGAASVESGDLLAACLLGLGLECSRHGLADEAGRTFREAEVLLHAGIKRLHGPRSDGLDRRALLGRLAQGYWQLGLAARQGGSPAEALDRLGHARALWEEMGRADGADDAEVACLTECLYALAELNNAEGRLPEALELSRRGVVLSERLVARHPAEVTSRRALARNAYLQGALLGRSDRPGPALERYRQAAGLFDQIARECPLVADYRRALGASHHNIGRLLVELGRPNEAIAAYERAIAIRQGLCDDPARMPGDASDCRGSWDRLGQALTSLGRLREAADAFARASAPQPITRSE